jgi:hypothetical protein
VAALASASRLCLRGAQAPATLFNGTGCGRNLAFRCARLGRTRRQITNPASLYIHASTRRAAGAAIEEFVDETRMGTSA